GHFIYIGPFCAARANAGACAIRRERRPGPAFADGPAGSFPELPHRPRFAGFAASPAIVSTNRKSSLLGTGDCRDDVVARDLRLDCRRNRGGASGADRRRAAARRFGNPARNHLPVVRLPAAASRRTARIVQHAGGGLPPGSLVPFAGPLLPSGTSRYECLRFGGPGWRR